MQAIKKVLPLLIVAILLSSCFKNRFELEVLETACKNFKIYEGTGSWVKESTCNTSTSLDYTLKVQFKHKGDQQCIFKVNVTPEFYKPDNNELQGGSFKNEYSAVSGEAQVDEETVTFTFEFSFRSQAEADAFNHLILNINTENELGDTSNDLIVRVNLPCATVDPDTYQTSHTVNVNSDMVEIKFWDTGAEDGDLIAVYLNGKWELENYVLLNAGESFWFELQNGKNDLVIFALNEGSVGPNTLGVSIDGGAEISMTPGLKTGSAIELNF